MKETIKNTEILALKYQNEKHQVKTELEYHKSEIRVLEQKEILLDKIIKDIKYNLGSDGSL